MREALVVRGRHLSLWVLERGGEGEGLGRTCTRYLVLPSCSTPLGDDL